MSNMLKDIASFGAVAAEEDSVLEYFVSTYAVDDIKEKDIILVLGRKGMGKTALVRFFTEQGNNALSKALNLKSYPWSVHAELKNSGSSEMEAYVSSWRYLIIVQSCLAVLNLPRVKNSPYAITLREFFEKSYGSIEPDLGSIVQLEKVSFEELKLEPTLFGSKLGSISFNRAGENRKFGLELDALSLSLLGELKIICFNEGLTGVQLHFDELDLGLSTLDETNKQILTGLILAARYVRKELRNGDFQISPFIYLRTDLWAELSFSDKNKISESQALHLTWDSAGLLNLLNRRISAKLGDEYNWDEITDEDVMRGTQRKWDHILARTLLRPRDVIRFANTILDEAKKRWKKEISPSYLFSNSDVSLSRESYSSYLKSELDDEINPHWVDWNRALQAISAISKITFDKESFETEYNKRSKGRQETAEEALEKLFRFSIIGYRQPLRTGGSGYTFLHSDPKAVWDNGVERFKVHPGLKEYAKLRE